MDAGVLKNVIFLFPEIFDLVRQSLNDGSLLLDFTVSLLKESYQCTLGQVPVPLCDVTHFPTYRQGTRLGNLVLATKILTAMLKSSCTFLTEVKSKRAPVKQDKIDDTIPGWLYTLLINSFQEFIKTLLLSTCIVFSSDYNIIMKCDAHVRNVLVTHDYLIENEITRIAMQDTSKYIFNIFK